MRLTSNVSRFSVGSFQPEEDASEQPLPSWFSASSYTHQVAADILQYGPIARTTLAQLLGLSQGALSRITSDLLHYGVIEELDPEDPDASIQKPLPLGFIPKESGGERRGRPQTALRIRKNERTFIGINVRGNSALATALNVACEELGEVHIVDFEDQSPRQLCKTLTTLVNECLEDIRNAGLSKPVAVGISIGGHTINDSTVTFAPFLHWDGSVNLASMMSEECGIPTGIFNDLDSLLHYECWFEAGVGIPRFAVVTMGAGLGYSLAQNGQPIDYGDKSYGLIAHTLVDPEGPRCYQGHKGCAECLTNDSIAEQYSQNLGRTTSFDDFAHDARHGVPQATQLLNRTCFRLGVFIATVANIAMPQKILVAGESSFIVRMNTESIRKGIESYRHSQAAPVSLEILDDTWDRWASAAASRVISRYILGGFDAVAVCQRPPRELFSIVEGTGGGGFCVCG
ncbi:ROK family protein, partial [Bifidobacterium aquikefiri]|uniref:ROK family protein n=2 Tax=Bifidobacterium aquikefiri TaxID=1653207 RepID=UPI0039E96B92